MEFVEIENARQQLSRLADEKVLLAHSCGVDSSVLAHLLKGEGISFAVAHCNFKLRGSASDSDQLYLEKWCRQNKVPFFTTSFDTTMYKRDHKQSTQLAARNLRYDWFNELQKLHGFTILLTAHHLNDQFETFLMNAARGTGISGLVGIPDRDWIKRPLNRVSKNEILDYAHKQKITWREDASNATEAYRRNEFRHQLVEPWLENHPEVLQNFLTTLEHLKEANSFIHSQLKSLEAQLFKATSGGIEIEVNLFKTLPQQAFCVHHWFSPLGFSAKEVVKLLNAPKGKMLVSATHRLIRERNSMMLLPLSESGKDVFYVDLNTNGMEVPISLHWKITKRRIQKSWGTHQAALDTNALKSPLFLRKYQKGDYFYPSGMNGKKSLSKFFRDEKYSTLEKEAQWILCAGDQVVWIVGKRCDARFIAKETTTEILIMQME